MKSGARDIGAPVKPKDTWVEVWEKYTFMGPLRYFLGGGFVFINYGFIEIKYHKSAPWWS